LPWCFEKHLQATWPARGGQRAVVKEEGHKSRRKHAWSWQGRECDPEGARAHWPSELARHFLKSFRSRETCLQKGKLSTGRARRLVMAGPVGACVQALVCAESVVHLSPFMVWLKVLHATIPERVHRASLRLVAAEQITVRARVIPL
jgi:hypothetical protein